jgi:hypothetical protein
MLIDQRSPARPTVRQVRGSLVVSSLRTLRELGYFERYQEQLHPEYSAAVLYALAASWLRLEVAMAQYAACARFRARWWWRSVGFESACARAPGHVTSPPMLFHSRALLIIAGFASANSRALPVSGRGVASNPILGS